MLIDGDLISGMRSNLARIRREFDAANERSDVVADAVGHPGLADRVRWFAVNWDHRRGELVGQLSALDDQLKVIEDGFCEADSSLAGALGGDC